MSSPVIQTAPLEVGRSSCRVCEQQRSCSPGFCRNELHATESAVEVRRARRRLGEAATDERVGVIHSGQRRGHSGRCGVCPRHSGEARDRLWRSGSRPPISVNPASTPFRTAARRKRRGVGRG